MVWTNPLSLISFSNWRTESTTERPGLPGNTDGAGWRSFWSFAHFNHTLVHACSHKSIPLFVLFCILGPGLLIIPPPPPVFHLYPHSFCVSVWEYVCVCSGGGSGEQWLTDRSEGALRYCSPSGHGREERIMVHHIWSEMVRFQYWITVSVGSVVLHQSAKEKCKNKEGGGSGEGCVAGPGFQQISTMVLFCRLQQLC